MRSFATTIFVYAERFHTQFRQMFANVPQFAISSHVHHM